MNQKGKTADEKLLIRIYEMAAAKGDLYAEISVEKAATSLGQRKTAASTIVKHLAQANLVKKGEEGYVALTRGGIQWVEGQK